ncbi:MAG: aldehyde oxidase and xanthine dehydrogenase, molybdopterin binding [Rhodospirillales bacterium]|nr:aldehyde oxidase and xanthine dehydrogenase, molybdopterin binding [Rhodospirillales bacterium]
MTTTIGAPLNRIDARLKVTGAARYSAEMPVKNVAHAVLIQSTIANGRIADIDTAAAEQSPGVLLVMTHRNAPKLGGKQKSVQQPGEDYPLLQDDAIHYNGQHIGVLVAETFEAATHAARLVTVRYDEDKSVVRLGQVLDKLAVPQHFRGGARLPDSSRGNPDQEFVAAPVKIDQTYQTPIEHHNPLEPHAVIAVWTGDELVVFHSSQSVAGSHKTIAGHLGISDDKVRTVSHFIGGGFGSKGSTWPHVTIAAMAARIVNRPVKLVLTRRQMYTSNGFRPQTRQHLRLGADRDGRLIALRHDSLSHTASFGEWVEPCGLSTEIMYSCPNLGVSHRVAPTDTGIPTFMRAPGEASGMFALESAMDELAEALAIDPLELRLRNYAEQDEHEKLPWSSKSLKQCYERGAAAFGWNKRERQPGSMRNGDLFVGWGMASATYPMNRSKASATVRLQADGRAIVQCATQDIGTGTYTIIAQVAADAIGLPVERVTVQIGDSNFPEAPVSGGSQTAASVTPAVDAASRDIRKQLVDLATTGSFKGLRSEDLDVVDGAVVVKSDPSRRAEIGTLLAGRDALTATKGAEPGDEKKQFSMHSFGAHFVEVHVDPELGEVRVARYVGAFAAGRVLNAKTARSQIIGGIVYGLGMALTEETDLDHRSGRVLNGNIAEYLVPVHADVPDIEVILIEEQDPHVNPLGVKGMGELPMVGVAGAVANAVFHATGKRIRYLPIRPDKLLRTA